MEVDSAPGSYFPSLTKVLPSQTLNQAVEPLSADDEPVSPEPTLPSLTKNAYGLESFAEYCAAVDRVKAGLPAKEAPTSSDRTKPVIIQGIQFRYWDPNHSESECSDTDSDTSALRSVDDPSDNAKSTWSAATPRRSILRQSTSSPLVRLSELPLEGKDQNQLIYDYASTASPSSRRTSRFSSRRISIDAGVQAEPVEVENDKEEVMRVAHQKRISGARRSSVQPIKRGSIVHALAGFTGIGRTDSGAVICLANGKKFELIVDAFEREDGNELAVQCSGVEIDSEIEAKFRGTGTEVIDVDGKDESTQTESNPSNHVEIIERGNNPNGSPKTGSCGRMSDIPSPEQLRSATHLLTTPVRSELPDLEGVPVSEPEENGKTIPAMLTPAQSIATNEQDVTKQMSNSDEVIATAAQTAPKRILPPAISTPKARVSAPPRIVTSYRASMEKVPDSLPDQEGTQSHQTAPPVVKFSQLPDKPLIHAIADPTKTSPPKQGSLDIVRQQVLSIKPEDEPSLANQLEPAQLKQDLILHLNAVRGADIRPTASAYQMAAMATLSPQSYLRVIQPPQSRVIHAAASPAGMAAHAGINIAPPQLISTPPVATIAVAPDSHKRVLLAAAPRKSHGSITRSELTTPLHDPRPVSITQEIPKSNGIKPHAMLETNTPSTFAPPLKTARYEAQTSRKGESSVHKTPSNASDDRTGQVSRKESTSAARSPGKEEREMDFVVDDDDNDDDEFDALPDMDDDGLDIPVDIDAECDVKLDLEIEPNDKIKPSSAKSRSRKISMASSKSRASKKTHQSSDTERRRISSVTQDFTRTSSKSNDPDVSVIDVEEMPEVQEQDLDDVEEKRVSRKRKKSTRTAKTSKPAKKATGEPSTKRGQKRWRELKSLPTEQTNANESSEGGLRRSKRQRFPRLKFWRNETVSYERRLSQAIPTIAEVIVEVGGSESDDDTWFGRR